MNRCAFALAATCLVPAACLAQETGPDDAWVLEPGRAGPFRVGMSVEDIYRTFDWDQGPLDLVDLSWEGTFTPAFEIQLPGSEAHPSVVALIDRLICAGRSRGWVVTMLRVDDSRFRTRDGLGVGSTFAELKDAGWVDERGVPTPKASDEARPGLGGVRFRFVPGAETEFGPPAHGEATVKRVVLRPPLRLLGQMACERYADRPRR